MISPDRPRLAVLAGPEESLSPAEIARSADGLADLLFLLDSGDGSAPAQALRTVADALAPTMAVNFSDLDACLDAVRRGGAGAVTTFTDRLCQITALLDAKIKGTITIVPPWGQKDVQRQMLQDAGVSRIRSARIDDEGSLRAFIRSVGFPVVVKPTGGAASRDTWLLERESDVAEFTRLTGSTGPAAGLPGSRGGLSGAGRSGNGMFAEQFIAGERPLAPHLADYVSAEVFRFSPAAQHSAPLRAPGASLGALGPAVLPPGAASPADLPGAASPAVLSSGALSQAFVTDRLVPAWPCRETGLVLPSVMAPDQQVSVIAAAGRALDGLGAATGVFHVELKPSWPAPEIIEVNGRLGGFIARLVRYGTGKDLGRLALSCALGLSEGLNLRWDRCVLVLLFQPPARAERIIRAPSRREIARRPGVLAVDKVSGAGTIVDWRDGTNFPATWLWLAADNHAELRSRLIDIAEFLADEFIFADSAGGVVDSRTWLKLITDGT